MCRHRRTHPISVLSTNHKEAWVLDPDNRPDPVSVTEASQPTSYGFMSCLSAFSKLPPEVQAPNVSTPPRFRARQTDARGGCSAPATWRESQRSGRGPHIGQSSRRSAPVGSWCLEKRCQLAGNGHGWARVHASHSPCARRRADTAVTRCARRQTVGGSRPRRRHGGTPDRSRSRGAGESVHQGGSCSPPQRRHCPLQRCAALRGTTSGRSAHSGSGRAGA